MSSKLYEHAILELDASNMTVAGEKGSVQEVLNERGRTGWELVSTAPGVKSQVLLFLKRKVRMKH